MSIEWMPLSDQVRNKYTYMKPFLKVKGKQSAGAGAFPPLIPKWETSRTTNGHNKEYILLTELEQLFPQR